MLSSLLKVPTPVSTAQWTTTPTKYGPAGSPLCSSGLGGGGGLSGGGGGGLGALSGGLSGLGPVGGGGVAAAGGSPLLSSRYASLAAGL